MRLAALTLLVLTGCAAVTALDYLGFASCVPLSGSFNLHWTLNVPGGSISMAIEAQTTGWAAVGFGSQMIGSDAVLGWVSNGGVTYAFDYYLGDQATCNGAGAGVCRDDLAGGTNNVGGISGRQTNGVTIIQFTRPIAATDATIDRAISTTGTMSILCAYSPLDPSGTIANPNVPQHSVNFITSVNFASIAAPSCTSLLPLTSAPPATTAPPVTPAPVTPAPVTPAPVTPAPVTPPPVTSPPAGPVPPTPPPPPTPLPPVTPPPPPPTPPPTPATAPVPPVPPGTTPSHVSPTPLPSAAPSVGPPYLLLLPQMRAAHGALMGVAWSFFGVIGWALARYAKPAGLKKWFPLHIAAQTLMLVMALAGLILATLYTTNHFSKPHSIIGIITLGLGFLQIPLGIIADALYDPDRTSAPVIDVVHWWVGRLALVLAVPVVFLGLDVSGVAPLGAWIGYGIWVGLVIIAIVLMETVFRHHWQPAGAGATPTPT